MKQHRFFLQVVYLAGIAFMPGALEAQELKSSMWKVAASLNELQSYLYSEERFTSDESADRVQGILDSLEGDFHTASQFSRRFRDEPGFVATLDVTRQLIKDSNHRFKEGQRSYARWRLRSLPSSCISCHTRFHVADGGLALKPAADVPAAQQAEFLLATRQFDKALGAYEALIFTPSPQRIDALRSWLLIEVRVKQDPKAALEVLDRLRASGQLSSFEAEEVQDWLASLRRWEKEIVTKSPLLRKAEALIKTAGDLSNQDGGQRGTVELLRATAILHSALDRGELRTIESKQEALYLLGMAYSELSMRVVPEMPDMLLEQAIRTSPGTAAAKKSYRALERYTNRTFSGITGTDIPADVQLRLKELHDLAYGVPQPPSRI